MTSEQIWELLKPHFSTKSRAVFEISELLHLSQPSVYNRLSGKTPFALHELEKIASHWKLHFLIKSPEEEAVFACRYGVLNGKNRKPIEYLTDVTAYLKSYAEASNLRLTWMMQELPPFIMYSFPHLSAFKFYHWGNSTWMSEGLGENYLFSNLLNNQALHRQTAFITDFTAQHSSCEFYQGDILQKTLSELAYYMPVLKKDPLFSLEIMVQELHGALSSLRDKCARPRSDQQIFLINVKTLTDSILLESDEGSIAFVSFDEPHYLEMRDPSFLRHFHHMKDIMMDNAICISGMNRLERRKYFERQIKGIDEFFEKFSRA